MKKAIFYAVAALSALLFISCKQQTPAEVIPTVELKGDAVFNKDGKASLTVTLSEALDVNISISFDVLTSADEGKNAIPASSLTIKDPLYIVMGRTSATAEVVYDITKAKADAQAVITIGMVTGTKIRGGDQVVKISWNYGDAAPVVDPSETPTVDPSENPGTDPSESGEWAPTLPSTWTKMSAWKGAYLGRETDVEDGETYIYDVFEVTGTGDILFSTNIGEVGDFEKTDAIAAAAEETAYYIYDLYELYVEYYKDYFDVEISDVLCDSEYNTDYYEELENGNYDLIIFAFDENGNPTGPYNVCTVTVDGREYVEPDYAPRRNLVKIPARRGLHK